MQVTNKVGNLLRVSFGVTDHWLLGLQVLLNANIGGSNLRKGINVFIACLVQRVTVAVDRIWIIVLAYGRLWGIFAFDLGPEFSIRVIRSLSSRPFLIEAVAKNLIRFLQGRSVRLVDRWGEDVLRLRCESVV